ncbi:MAG: polyphosphate:AMP phosphotransferase [Deltaproteobacteria bacterium]|nr:polyphosphate:AMP phosphotransferase [Deltaproteobacteria bacterium]
MFEIAEIGNKLSKEIYDQEEPKIRHSILEAQEELREAKIPCIIIVSGNEGAGKGDLVKLLNQWMDARAIATYALTPPTDEEHERPRFWRFWRILPPKGKIGIFFGSWYTNPIVDRVFKKIDSAALDLELKRIREFESMLVNEGVLVLKFWFHLSKKEQKKRLQELEKNPKTAWKVTKLHWDYFKKYDKFRKISEHSLRETNLPDSPWIIIEAVDNRYKTITFTKTITEALQKRVEAWKRQKKEKEPPLALKAPELNVMASLDMTQKLSEKEYNKKLPDLQAKLNELTTDLYQKNRAMVLVFEGSDAAGKGGAIRRVVHSIDARTYKIAQIAAPTSEEAAQPYLWRFWRHLPRLGSLVIFDRSWYGRVLVERVEGFCAVADWKRAYEEINNFEEQLADFGMIVMKFWLTITKEEQLARFTARENTPYKRYKITEEDWRNREKWDAYTAAVCDMVEKTSTENSAWTLVESNDKYFARVKVLQTICDRLTKELH